MKASRGNGLQGIAVLALLLGVACASAPSQTVAAPHPTTKAEVQAAQNSPQNHAPIVVAVRIVNESGKVLPEPPGGLAIQVDKPLDRAQVAETLRVLFRTGDYADVRAVESPADGGVRIDFVVREQLFFNRVVVQGLTSPPSDASAVAALQFSLGQPYRKDIVEEGLARLRDALHDEGLYASQVSAEMIPHQDTRQMDLIIHVISGPRSQVSEVRLKNGTEYTDADILRGFRVKAKTRITSARIQRGTERIRKFLVKKGHLNARAVVRRGEYDAAKNAVPLDLDVTEGPRVKIVVTGAKFSGGEMKRLVPVYQEGAVDADLLEEGKRNIRERLEREGYF